MSAGNEASEQFQNTGYGEAIVKELNQIVQKLDANNQSATKAETFAQQLNVREPTLILGVDNGRTRALLRANNDDVYIGRYSEIANSQNGNPLGYLVSKQSGDEIKNIDTLYAIYNPQSTPASTPVYIHLLIERNV